MNDSKLPKFRYLTTTLRGEEVVKEVHLPKWLRFLTIDNDNDGYVDWQQVPKADREALRKQGILLDEHGRFISSTPPHGKQDSNVTDTNKSQVIDTANMGDSNNQHLDPLAGLLDGLLTFTSSINTPNDTKQPTSKQPTAYTSSHSRQQTHIPPTYTAHKNPSPDASRSAQSNIVRILLLLVGLGVLARVFLF